MYRNRLDLIGFIGNDAETKYTASGKMFAQFSLATQTSWKDSRDEWQSRTEWHRVVVWGEKLAAFAATLKKGAHIAVEGELQRRVWECKATSIQRLDRWERNADHPVTDEPVAEQSPGAGEVATAEPATVEAPANGKARRSRKSAPAQDTPAGQDDGVPF